MQRETGWAEPQNVTSQPRVQMAAGFTVPPGTPAIGDVQMREVAPALVASMVVWSPLETVLKSYGPLLEFMKQQNLKPVWGWREWYLYFESDNSQNSLTWVQHLGEEV